MRRFVSLLQSYAPQIWAVLIAIVLWLQVHGQGAGTLSMEVTLQLQGLPQNMVVVNDLPDSVHVTVSGPQARLKAVKPQDVHVPFDASGLTMPGVVERTVKIADVRLPAGLDIEKIQPDRIELQIDRVVEKSITVMPRMELPEGWTVESISVQPAQVRLSGPEVWLDALSEVETTAIQPEFKAGPFEAVVGVASPTGKAIRLVDGNAKFRVRGVLVHQERNPGAERSGEKR
ncbi:MAG: CdaR family protein [Mariprofundaceae bacterium]|nr:CdaR family protein [Mariprofundaceae bacterium]